MGRSGSGKGTQIQLLKDLLSKNNKQVYHFESGGLFRSMIKGEGYTSDQLRSILKKGELVPDFFTDWLLVNGMVENINDPEQVLILDGYPRTSIQADTLDKTLAFYNRDKGVVVIHIDVSENEVRRRMIERGRGDDVDMEAVENRIKFYNEKVLPTIEILRTADNYTVIDVNGEGDINDIHNTIKAKLGTN